MKHLTILVPDGENNLSSIVGAYKIFTRANAFQKEAGKKEVFRIELAGVSGEIDFYGGLFTARPHKCLSDIMKTDLVIIPSLNHHFQQAIKLNGEMIEWIVKQYRRGASVASICTGAYLLAAAGLLDGKSWSAADELKQLSPKVNLQTDRLINNDQGVSINGGAYSFVNLVIYRVENYYERKRLFIVRKYFRSSRTGKVNPLSLSLPDSGRIVVNWSKKRRPISKRI